MKDRLRRLQGFVRADEFERQWRDWSLGGPKPGQEMSPQVRDALRVSRQGFAVGENKPLQATAIPLPK